MLGSTGHDHFFLPVRQTIIPLELGDDGLFQFVDAAGGCISCEAISNSLYGCFLDVVRRLEIGFSEAKVHHVDPLCPHLLGARGNDKCGRWLGESGAARKIDAHALRLGPPAPLRAARSFNIFLVIGVTNAETSPPRSAISLTSRELRYEYFSWGIRNTVSISSDSFRF